MPNYSAKDKCNNLIGKLLVRKRRRINQNRKTPIKKTNMPRYPLLRDHHQLNKNGIGHHLVVPTIHHIRKRRPKNLIREINLTYHKILKVQHTNKILMLILRRKRIWSYNRDWRQNQTVPSQIAHTMNQ